ncbi:MAG: glycoside hydrolase family 2 protein [Candidatus Hodarchaeota archaeon]
MKFFRKFGKNKFIAMVFLILFYVSSFFIFSWLAPSKDTSVEPYQMKEAVLMTGWAGDVNISNPLPEYPRPQLYREKWLNLNGIWQFQDIPTMYNRETPYPSGWSEILVPFPVESAISGIMEHHDWMWYRRSFILPGSWDDQRIILHFEAVDWQTDVWVDGEFLGTHQGGYDPFSFEITAQMVDQYSAEHAILVRVHDPTNEGYQPVGKQSLDAGGTFYTSCSGIWQTVWLEPVSPVSMKDIKMTPDIDAQQLNLTVSLSDGNTLPSNLSLQAVVHESGNVTSNSSFPINSRSTSVSLPVPTPILWNGLNPFLYNLTLQLLSDGELLDEVESYFGMRKVHSELVNGSMQIMLNNQPVYLCGPLDQGYWPDGIYTAPTDEALAWDVNITKQYGFNMTRKHVKIESRRWYYHCDKMGLLVFQDMANGPFSNTDPACFKRELQRLIDVHYNSPCIIEWTIFNEGWGQHDTVSLTQWAEGHDPTRLVSSASGWVDYNAGDIIDYHSYPFPFAPENQDPPRVKVCGEYGGIGYKITNHTWTDEAWAYLWVNDQSSWIEEFEGLARQLNRLRYVYNISAVVYTQLTDIEQEMNGLVTYDRKVLKVPFAPVADANRLWNDTMTVSAKEVLPCSGYYKSNWTYTFEDSQVGLNWNETGYDDSSWATGPGGFGNWGTPGTYIGTVWDSWDIWLRKSFTVTAEDIADLDSLYLFMHHDDDAEIYINGILAASVTGYTVYYDLINITSAAKNSLNSSQPNCIAVHCKQAWGGQYIDVGILKWEEM